jgi:hypothetical protein
MIQKTLISFAVLFLGVWVWFCHRQITLLRAELTQMSAAKTQAVNPPPDYLKAAETHLEAVRLAEANRQVARQEEETRQREKEDAMRGYAVAIGTVFDGSKQAKEDAAPPQASKKKEVLAASFNQRRYLQTLQGISVSKCPIKFQLAWHDFLYQKERADNLGHAISEVSLVLHGDLSSLDSHAVPDAWHHCEMVALEFGVSAPKGL